MPKTCATCQFYDKYMKKFKASDFEKDLEKTYNQAVKAGWEEEFDERFLGGEAQMLGKYVPCVWHKKDDIKDFIRQIIKKKIDEIFVKTDVGWEKQIRKIIFKCWGEGEEYLISNITNFIRQTIKDEKYKAIQETFATIPNPSHSQAEVDRLVKQAVKEERERLRHSFGVWFSSGLETIEDWAKIELK